ncbi:MAG: glycosyltransferase [Desertimonas sp.]
MSGARVIVVPCFNESRRLDVDALVRLARGADATVLAVDDGSTDDTGVMLAAAATEHSEIDVLVLAGNGGKAEAVRAGLRTALVSGAAVVGYYDADLATPVGEMVRLVETLAGDDRLEVVVGSRVGLLGHDIERRPWRHYLGRVFATAASAALGVPIYDTQCGAKVFRATPALGVALVEPFTSRWAFDVELLGRLLRAGTSPDALKEVPLRAWRDVAGSGLRPRPAVRAGLDVLVMGWSWRRQRGASNNPTV